jgi:hypothetical protein
MTQERQFSNQPGAPEQEHPSPNQIEAGLAEPQFDRDDGVSSPNMPQQSVEVETRPASGRPESQSDDFEPLLDQSRTGEFRSRWESIQSSFVDEPRAAVGQAEGLLDQVLGTLTESFRGQRRDLESKWESGGEPSTEDLRQAVRRYRTLFEKLLAA